jgi:hypothetical protein
VNLSNRSMCVPAFWRLVCLGSVRHPAGASPPPTFVVVCH